MIPPVVVPDASVLLKWILHSKDEGSRDRALALRDRWLAGDCEIVVPSLWVFEVGNIVGMKEPDLAGELMEVLIDYRIDEEAPSSFCGEALDLMRRFGVTFYDASYHAVAINRSGLLVTADAMYTRKTAAAGHVLNLADFG